jgi:predicted secreted Zn-dependent protease
MAATVTDSVAKVTVGEKTIHYSVAGNTGKAIYDQIRRKGPKLPGDKKHKVATATISFDLRNAKGAVRGTRCVVTHVDVHVSIVYRMPKWTGRGNPAVRKAWDAFEAHVWRHEKRHKDIAMEFAKRVENGVKRLSGDAKRDCAGMVEQAKKLAVKEKSWHERKQAGFDASWFGDGGRQNSTDRALIAAK